jgi:hypothetical protein
MFLLACQWRAQGGSEEKTLFNHLSGSSKPAHEVNESVSSANDTLPKNDSFILVEDADKEAMAGKEELKARTQAIKERKRKKTSKKTSRDTIYATYGNVILDRIMSPGVYFYQSKDESLRINQPWDGLLIHWTNKRGDEKVEYYDKKHNLIKTINLWEITPYTKDNYPLLSDKQVFNSEYESISRGVQDDTTYDYRKDVTEYRTQIDVFAQSSGLAPPNKNIIVQFTLIPMHKDIVIGWNTTLVVFDSTGNEINRLDDVEFDVSYPVCTRDGRYLAFTYGTTMDNDFSFLRKSEGIRIYDLSSKDVIYEDMGHRGLSPAYTAFGSTPNGLFFISKTDANRMPSILYTKLIFDCTNRLLFTKSFTSDENKELTDLVKTLGLKSWDDILRHINFNVQKF